MRAALLQNLAHQSVALDRLFSTIATPHGTANGAVDGQALSHAYTTLNGTVQSFAGILEDAIAHQRAYCSMLKKQALVDRLNAEYESSLPNSRGTEPSSSAKCWKARRSDALLSVAKPVSAILITPYPIDQADSHQILRP